MSDPVVYELESSWTKLGKWLGFFCVGLALGSTILPRIDPGVGWPLALGSAAFWFVLGALCLKLWLSPEEYSLEIASDGVRAPTQGIWIPWSQLGGTRERASMQRIDLLDRAGRKVAALEYQVAEFNEAIMRIASELPVAGTLPAEFRRTLGVTLASNVAFIVGGILFWYYSEEPSGLWLAGLFLAVIVWDALTEVLAVSLKPEELIVQRGFRRTRSLDGSCQGVSLSQAGGTEQRAGCCTHAPRWHHPVDPTGTRRSPRALAQYSGTSR